MARALDDKQLHIHIEKIRLLYNHSLTPAILSGVAACFLVAALWQTAEHQRLLTWLYITLFLALVRILLLIMFKRARPRGASVLAWEKPYSISLLIVFLAWSIGLIYIMPQDSLTAVFILNTFSIGLAGAAISWYSPLRYLQILTISLALLPMIFILLTLGHEEAWWVGIAATCMYVSCMITSVLLQKTFNGNLELAYDLEQARAKAEKIACTDALTGLNNRRAFFNQANVLLAHCQRSHLPASLVMFDIDYFKKINDEFGHAGGDAVLQHLAELLKTKLRKSDVSCRFGGEEFVVLLPETKSSDAKIMATNFKKLLERSPATLPNGKQIMLTASYGISDKGGTLDELINTADWAMYHSKDNGRNQITLYTAKLSPKQTAKASAGKPRNRKLNADLA